MIKCSKTGAYYTKGKWVFADGTEDTQLTGLGMNLDQKQTAKEKTIAYSILKKHNHGKICSNYN